MAICCAVVHSKHGQQHDDGAMFRVGPDNYQQALAIDGVQELSFTGRPMKGMVECGAELLQDDKRRTQLLTMAQAFTNALPPK